MRKTAVQAVILPERYIDQNVLQYVTWPQYQYGCSVASLTCVVNYLFAGQIGVQTAKQVGKVIRANPETLESASIHTLQKWFRVYCAKKGLNGRTEIAFGAKDVAQFNPDDWDDMVNNRVLARIDRVIRHKKKILVYATDNHFLMVAGYYDGNEKPVDVFIKAPDVRFYILADHYYTDMFSQLPDLLKIPVKQWLDKHVDDWNLYLPGPILCKRWGDIWRDFRGKDQCFIVFERT